jgi:hypothetical protein
MEGLRIADSLFLKPSNVTVIAFQLADNYWRNLLVLIQKLCCKLMYGSEVVLMWLIMMIKPLGW